MATNKEEEGIAQQIKQFFKKHSKLITIIIVGFLIGFSIPFLSQSEKRERTTGTVDLSSLITEDDVTFEQEPYKDKNLVITFTRSNCPHCDDQALAFEELHSKYDFEHFYIPVNESPWETKARFDHIGVDYDILIDPNANLAKKLQVKVVPTTIIKRAGEAEFEAVEGGIETTQKETKEDLEKDAKRQPTMEELLNK